jgi:hypothetical protein
MARLVPHPVLPIRTLEGNNVYDIFVGNAALQAGCKAKLGVARGRHRPASRISLHFVLRLDRILSSQPSERRRQSAQGAARNFEEWVEAEVQARLAQWLLARKNPERAAAAHPATIDSLDRSAARRTIRPAARLTAIRSITRATLDSAAQSALARPSAADSPLARVTTIEPSDFATIGSAAIECAITRSATRAADSRPMNRPAFTRSATACRTMQSLALVHPSAILKPRKLSKALLRASMNSSRTPPAVNKQSRHRLTLLPLSRCK